jgi:hypothetical protein
VTLWVDAGGAWGIDILAELASNVALATYTCLHRSSRLSSIRSTRLTMAESHGSCSGQVSIIWHSPSMAFLQSGEVKECHPTVNFCVFLVWG